ncbi:HhH-GPD family protein [Candidatus Vecturithrix granuli]|uniref:DNA-3-methyladenine glycosylase II n=1 Tax=Vecturithrix granuli TaxID=1499967 RepID=A0A081BXD4_VECG1|nr:HhH-GPD family protein [Candidatus Vecturithrix granuli]
MKQRLNHLTLLKGVRELARRDEDLARIASKYGPPPLWEREPGFHTLLHIILEQQVSLASAKAAYNRLEETVHPFTPQNFLMLTDEQLKHIGFSRQKTRYSRELAQAIIHGSLDVSGLGKLEDEDAKKQLMKIKGIGAWTADIYVLMALGRPNIWPKGDLALEVAIQQVKGWERRPTPEEAKKMSDEWQPWRAVAARLLWHFYLSERKKGAPSICQDKIVSRRSAH